MLAIQKPYLSRRVPGFLSREQAYSLYNILGSAAEITEAESNRKEQRRDHEYRD